ncbi:MAG: hypothetical protein NZ651_07070 [Candidatus Bipolaricaulota bacterium]|nr:hypothetical protein [Candidatus Bipolaricaulota bacterium]MDW8127514.1 hypothetical protein [Candidatus Bipolaricaulota bacterium]
MKSFRVPELERAARTEKAVRPWSAAEVEILVRYYGKVPIQRIAAVLRKEFPPGRTYDSIRCKVRQLRAIGRL